MTWSTSEVGEKDVVHVPCGSTNVNTLQAQTHAFSACLTLPCLLYVCSVLGLEPTACPSAISLIV